MTVAAPPRLGHAFLTRLGGGTLVLCLSLLAFAAAVRMEGIAVAVAVFLWLLGLAAWRPRYGLVSVLVLATLFEPVGYDPFMLPGALLHSGISSWTPLGFVIFSPLEFLLLAMTAVVLGGMIIERRAPRAAQLWWPLLVFAGLLVLSLLHGILRGGVLNIALWETRALFVGVLVALLVPQVLKEWKHVDQIVTLLTGAVVLLSVDTIFRRFALIDTGRAGVPLDLAFAHESAIFMDFVVILLLARLVWPASGRQRLLALLIPFILYAQMLTERRAGWVALDLGLVLVAIFVFRLRRKVFYFLVLPLGLLYLGYLAAFWNASGPLAQPARAIRSINNPEGRDEASNIYRIIERANVRMNIRAHPVTGLGFGRQYVFYYPLPDLSWWPFWHYIPHNGVMWLWMKMGILGFLTFLTLCGAGIVRGVQLLKRSTDSHAAPVLVALVSLLLMLVVFAYVDVALNNSRLTVILGFVLGVIGAWGRIVAQEQEAT